MTDRAERLGNVLLEIHRQTCRGLKFEEITDIMVKERTIRYKSLYERAGVPFPGQNSGPPLEEIARWCAEHQYPPLHALAVNETGRPGYNYHNAPGWPQKCDYDNWPEEVRRCIEFNGYHDRI
jgi:hypothetical protein